MKKHKLLLAISLAIGSAPLFAEKLSHKLDLEMTGPEYARYFEANKDKDTGANLSAAIKNILNVGKRNLDWLKLINSGRPADQQLPLVTPELQTGIPIETPKAYNETTVLADYQTLLSQLPDAYKTVLLGTDPLPPNHTMPTDDDYLTWLRATNKVYESASRWSIMLPILSELASISYEDIRGYYFLGKVANLTDQLNGWSTLDAATQTQYSGWLVGLCHNSETDTSSCGQELKGAIAHNKVLDFYNKYLNDGKNQWDSFFNIPVTRSDVTWTSQNPNLMLVPFTTPPDLEIKNWLADNIQDEWKWNGWQLQLDFTSNSSPNTTHIVFEAGTTPHVNDIAGSEITMDENSPLQDYGTRWTIRHEYGHTLGFPDCYVEFYDTDQKIIIDYQLDLADIMCSRKGHVQQRHFDELKSKYLH